MDSLPMNNKPVTSLMGFLDLKNYQEDTFERKMEDDDDDNDSLGSEVFCNTCDRCYGEVLKRDPAHKYGIQCFECYYYDPGNAYNFED